MSVDMSSASVDGLSDPRFSAVREAFVANFAERGDVGAAVAVSVGGRRVVDLWGGWADGARTTPWRRDTLVNVFSVGKGLTAACALLMVQRGRLELDVPVTRWWPEFGSQGKEAVTLRHMLSHQAGLPGLRAPLEDGAMLDWGRMIQALQTETPWWAPGAGHGYHVNTFGYLIGEMVRRASGRSLGAVLREEIAGPLGADVHIGLPASEHGRVAEFLWKATAPDPGPGAGAAAAPDQALMRRAAYSNPKGISGAGWVNTAAWRSAEIPSTNGHGTARGVADIYRALAARTPEGAGPILDASTIQAATTEQSNGLDKVLGRPSRFGLGFQLTQPERPIGPNPRVFGHFGAGGSLGFYDPDAQVAFGYVGNDMGPRWQNPRNRALIEAVYASL
jgi:CubicO group peptidase (beta-lactamase class C family)